MAIGREIGGSSVSSSRERYENTYVDSFDETIALSWKRCRQDYGLQPDRAPVVKRTDSKTVGLAFDLNGDILSAARHGLNVLSTQMGPAGYALLLADAKCLTLNSIVPNSFDQTVALNLSPGSFWSERNAGTNGIGTCVHDKLPLTVHKQEHFHTVNQQLSCSVTPIFNPTGELVACVNASCLGAPNDKRIQILALKMMMAQCLQVEQEHLRQSYCSHHVIQLTPLDISSGQYETLHIAVNAEERVVGATSAAFRWFQRYHDKVENASLLGGSVSALFGLDLDGLYRLENERNMPCSLKEQLGEKCFSLSIQAPASHRVASTKRKCSGQDLRPSYVGKHPSLQSLCAFDDQLKALQPCFERVVDKGLPILLLGETGTGKEAFARALHDISERASGPFVALNCASIPESLIESELFGYSGGTFTGARKQGMKGKLELASGGTLFLDEIGDMPILLQTRLLRVLAEREIHPLGTEFPQSIDLQVVSATHQDLPALIEVGGFRQDLYYRLNSVVFNIPPLRARKDFRELVIQILLSESDSTELQISEQAFVALSQHTWPGNIRELKNTLKYACAVTNGPVIGIENLPVALQRVTTPSTTNTVHTKSATYSCNQLQSLEAQKLQKLLEQCGWNVNFVAKVLQLSRSTVYRKMKRYQLG